MGWLKLAYHYVVFGIVGITPEQHHANLATIWYDLDRYQNCIEHCQKFLAYEDSDHVKAMMAYCHSALGDWPEAATAYRSIENIWAVPSFALGLAEAELRRGNQDEARKILVTVEVSHPNPPYDVSLALDQLKEKLEDSASE